MTLTITELRDATDRIRAFHLAPPAGQTLPDWTAGAPSGSTSPHAAAAAKAGLPDAQVRVELFTNPAPQADDQAVEVEIAWTGAVFTVPPGRSVIEVLEEGGVDLVHDCRRGDCGICQTGVISGTPDHRDVVLSEAERAAGKLIQICVSRAKTDRLVLDL